MRKSRRDAVTFFLDSINMFSLILLVLGVYNIRTNLYIIVIDIIHFYDYSNAEDNVQYLSDWIGAETSVQ